MAGARKECSSLSRALTSVARTAAVESCTVRAPLEQLNSAERYLTDVLVIFNAHISLQKAQFFSVRCPEALAARQQHGAQLRGPSVLRECKFSTELL
jgi:hypothetical protein